MPVNLTNDEYFSTQHLADNPAMYQPAVSNNFRFIVYGIDKMVRAGTTDEYITNGQEIIDFSVKSVTVPSFGQQPVTVNRGNSQIHFAGTPTFSDGTLVIYDHLNADGKSVLQAWQAQQYDVNRDVVYRVATTGYKKDCHLIEYTSEHKMVRYWELKGCWITNLTEGGFDVTNGTSAREVTAQIKYDRAIPHMPDEELIALE